MYDLRFIASGQSANYVSEEVTSFVRATKWLLLISSTLLKADNTSTTYYRIGTTRDVPEVYIVQNIYGRARSVATTASVMPYATPLARCIQTRQL